jgi:Fe-S oxidoreductase
LLAALGVDPVLIGVGRNNGYMASSLGLPETAKSLAHATLDELKASGAKRLLTLSPGDYFTFNQLYEERLEIPCPEDVELIEVTAFLAQQLKAGKLKLETSKDETPYAYVDPTLAVRVPTRHEAPRKLVNWVQPTSRAELLWRKERAHPVGSTALQFTRPDIAEKLTHARLRDAQQAGVQTLITDDPGTLHKLSEKAEQHNLHVQGLYELLAEHLT